VTPLEELKTLLFEAHDLSSAASVLGWDKETQMPPGGTQTRANQIATLSRLVHQRNTDPRLEELLTELEPQHAEADTLDGALVRLVRFELERQRKLPLDFVSEFARARIVSSRAWEDARARKDFKLFEPHLKTMFEFSRRKADLQGFDDHPYDALLDDFDPGLKTKDLRVIFASLREETVPLVKAIAERIQQRGEVADYSILTRDYPIDLQREFSIEVVTAYGYDWNRGRLDVAAHPFAINFSRDDVRMTTRFDRNYLPMALFGTLHESGHAMYEQGTAQEFARTPLARGCWSTVHESQSRLWENLVGRSRAFWTHWFEKLQQRFPTQLEGVDADTIYKLVNRVQPSLIRVEADEITYNLHIMLRFELELDVIEERVRIAELPEVWNARMQAYLGITPPDDALGVLQDIHWSEALIGYFPTYSLGNILSVQLLEAARQSLGDQDARWARGEYAPLLGWLREHVHQHGKRYFPNELIERATGSPLTAKPYVAYLKRKFSDLYGLKEE
jgi:carboxypeptidase Taq